MSQIGDNMEKEFNFMDELYKLVGDVPANVEYELDQQFKRAIFSPYVDGRYKELLTQYKLIWKVYRNSEGKHKVVKK